MQIDQRKSSLIQLQNSFIYPQTLSSFDKEASKSQKMLKSQKYVFRDFNSPKHQDSLNMSPRKKQTDSKHVNQISGLNNGLIQLKERLIKISSPKKTLEFNQNGNPSQKILAETMGENAINTSQILKNSREGNDFFLDQKLTLQARIDSILEQKALLTKQKQVLIERLTRQIKEKQQISRELAKERLKNLNPNPNTNLTPELAQATETIQRLEAEILKIKSEYVQTSLDCFNEALRGEYETIAKLRSQLSNKDEQIEHLSDELQEERLKTHALERQLKAQQSKWTIQLNSLEKRFQIKMSDKQNEMANLKNTAEAIESKYRSCLKELSFKDEFIFNYFVARSDQSEQQSVASQLESFKFNFEDKRFIKDYLKEQHEIQDLKRELSQLRAKIQQSCIK